jgi:hypothetical protein
MILYATFADGEGTAHNFQGGLKREENVNAACVFWW